MPMTWVTRARVRPSRGAMSVWLAASPDCRAKINLRNFTWLMLKLRTDR